MQISVVGSACVSKQNKTYPFFLRVTNSYVTSHRFIQVRLVCTATEIHICVLLKGNDFSKVGVWENRKRTIFICSCTLFTNSGKSGVKYYGRFSLLVVLTARVSLSHFNFSLIMALKIFKGLWEGLGKFWFHSLEPNVQKFWRSNKVSVFTRGCKHRAKYFL